MASNSILKLQVDDKQYEASIKNAQQGLKALQDALRNSGKSFADVDKQTEEYVRALGKMGTTAKTARGGIGEMSSAFVELSRIEKQLTDQERQSPVGKALTESLAQLKQRTIDAKNELQGLENQIKNVGEVKLPDTGGLFGGGKLDGMLQVFGGNLMTKAAGMAASFASEIGSCVQQGIELAKQGEGVRIAFERLGRGDILDGLRQATHGTVTDLELMKASVKFNDFKLPVEELGTMLAFAQQKAKDTGQSVDYMVDSIVTGLGRKSLMILDNLGLSAAEIKEKMAETGDMTKAVGEIIREQMAKAGDYVETAADRAAQANVNLQNKMEELGRKFAPLQEASNNLWTSMKIGIMDLIGGPLTNFINKLTEAGRIAQQYGVLGGNAKVSKMTQNLSNAREGIRQSLYNQQVSSFWRYINPREQQLNDIRAWQSGQRGEALQGRISAITEKYGSLDATKIQAEVDAAKKMLADYQQAAKSILTPVQAEINTNEAINNVESLKVKLAELEAQRKKAIAAGDTDLSKSLLKQINQTKADIRGLDPNALKTGGNRTTVDKEQATIDRMMNELRDAERKANATIKELEAKAHQTETTGISGLTSGYVEQTISELQARMESTDFGSEAFVNLKNQLKDATDLKHMMEASLTAGITVPEDVRESIMEGLFDGDIPQEALDSWKQQLQEWADENGVKINFETGGIEELSKEGKNTTESWRQAASVISSVGSALNSIEDPGVRIAAIVAEGIASLVAAYGDAFKKDQSSKSNIYQFLATTISATAQMIAQISQIHSATGYAQGGMIKGNSYSGDNIGGLVDGSQFVGLNAGEVVLNASQQSNLASNLQGGGSKMEIVGVLTGENVVLMADRWGRRTGRGELLFGKNL